MPLVTDVPTNQAVKSLGENAVASFLPAKLLTQPQETAERGVGPVPSVGSATMQGSSYSQQKGMGMCQSFKCPCPDTAENHYLQL